MTSEQQWVEQMLDLIRDAEQQVGDAERTRVKLIARVARAEKARAEAEQLLASLRTALDAYRKKHGLPDPVAETTKTQQAAGYFNMSAKDMIRRWADTHGNELRVSEASEFLASIGLFRDKEQASGTINPTLNRMQDEFERVSRGAYRRRSSEQSARRELSSTGTDGHRPSGRILRAVTRTDDDDDADDEPLDWQAETEQLTAHLSNSKDADSLEDVPF